MPNIPFSINSSPFSLTAVTLLMIEDSESDRNTYTRFLRSEETNYRILEADSLETGLELWRAEKPDIVLLDWFLPDGNGHEFLEAIRPDRPDGPLPVIVITGQGDEREAVRAMKSGAADYLVKGDLTAVSLRAGVRQVRERDLLARQLSRSGQRASIVAEIALRIRQSLDLDEVLTAIVREVRQFLQTDRVMVYQFNPDMSGTVVAESVADPWIACLNERIVDTCFQENAGGDYRKGRIFAADDIYAAPLIDCHRQLLEQFQVRANLVVPILLPQDPNDCLWGLLIAHHCQDSRHWEETDIQLLQELSVQSAIAIQQANLYRDLQNLNATLERQVEERTEALAIGERKFRGIFNHSFHFTGLLTPSGILLEANQTALTFKGLRLEEVINRPFAETPWWDISPETRDRLREAIARAAGGKSARYEVDILDAANRVCPIDFSLRPLRDESGQVVTLIAEGRDISEAKQTEATLRFQARILDRINDCVVSTDLEGTICTWNRGAERLYGYRAEEAIGQNIVFLYDDPAELQNLVLNPLAIENSHEAEVRVRSKTGELLYVSLRLSTVYDERGRPIRWIGCANDITRRKQAEIALRNNEIALRRSEEFNRLAVEAGRIGTWDLVLPARACLISSGMARLMDYPDEQTTVSVLQWQESVVPEDRSKMVTALADTIERGVPFELEYRVRLSGDGIRWLYSRGEVTRGETGNPVRIRGISIDIGARKQAETALFELNQQLEAKVAERTAELNKLSERLTLALKSGSIGCWDWDIQQNITIWDDRMYEIYGFSETVPPRELFDTWSRSIHPEDREVLESVGQQISSGARSAVTGNVDYSGEFRIARPDGSLRFIQCYGTVVRDAEGDPQSMIGINFDISDRKQAEFELIRSRDLREAIFNEATDALFLVDPETLRTLDCNRRAVELFEAESRADPIDIEGHLLQKRPFTPEEIRSIVEEIDARGYWSREIEYNTLKGSSFWGNIATKQITVAGREKNLVRVTDISARKRAEEENRRLKERLQFLLSYSPAVIFSCKPSGNYDITFINENVRALMGYEPEYFLGNNYFWANHVHPEDFSRIFVDLPRLFNQDLSIHEYRFQHRDGHYIWVRSGLRLVRDAAGEPLEIVGYSVDISDRVRAEIALRQSEEFKQRLLESSGDCIKVIDRDGRLIYLNEGGKCLLEIDDVTPFLNAEWVSLWPPESGGQIEEAIETASRGQSSRFRGYCPTAKGKPKWWDVAVTPIFDSNGEVFQILATSRDVTERELYEARLQKTNEELARATRLKDEFLANMSHELRTPLNAILGMSEALQEEVLGSLNERQQKSIATIEKSGRHLLELINDILDLAKIASGKMELHRAPVSIENLCESSLLFVRQQAFLKRIRLDKSIPDGLGRIAVDERRIRQVLINLLTNAVKFTPENGQVRLSVAIGSGETRNDPAAVPDSLKNTDSPLILFQIADTGIGIAPDDLKYLFQPFVQIDSNLDRRQTGTGLGLAMVKQITELHGGRVAVESQPGRGSCFTVALPYESPRTVPASGEDGSIELAATTKPSPSGSPLILLAEDNEANITTFSSYLTACNYRLILAKNGEEAVTLTRERQPDIVLMDIQMPGMDGLEAIRLLRADGRTATVPIIVLSALAMPGDRERCLAAGADRYLGKPVRLKQLVEVIQRVYQESQPRR